MLNKILEKYNQNNAVMTFSVVNLILDECFEEYKLADKLYNKKCKCCDENDSRFICKHTMYKQQFKFRDLYLNIMQLKKLFDGEIVCISKNKEYHLIKEDDDKLEDWLKMEIYNYHSEYYLGRLNNNKILFTDEKVNLNKQSHLLEGNPWIIENHKYKVNLNHNNFINTIEYHQIMNVYVKF